MEGRPNSSVIMPDISDGMAIKSEDSDSHKVCSGPQAALQTSTVTVSAVETVSVSSAVPVASLINVSSSGETTFNVITSEQLQVNLLVHLYHLTGCIRRWISMILL